MYTIHSQIWLGRGNTIVMELMVWENSFYSVPPYLIYTMDWVIPLSWDKLSYPATSSHRKIVKPNMTAGFGVGGMASKLTTTVVSVHGKQQIYQLLQQTIFTQKLYQCGKVC